MSQLSADVSSRFFFFLYKKVERIVTAVYLITNLISPEESLKWQLRHSALSLIGELLPLKDTKRSFHVEVRVVPIISELLSLLDIGRAAELISPMNAELLTGELAQLGRLLKERYGVIASDGYLASDFFNVFEEDHHTSLLNSVNDASSKGHDRGNEKDTTSASVERDNIKDKVDFSKGHSREGKKIRHISSSNEELASARKDKILAFLRHGGVLSIREIRAAISDYSEKTIQRDLNTLISEGRVKQEGKRRWTRYSLRPRRE